VNLPEPPLIHDESLLLAIEIIRTAHYSASDMYKIVSLKAAMLASSRFKSQRRMFVPRFGPFFFTANDVAGRRGEQSPAALKSVWNRGCQGPTYVAYMSIDHSRIVLSVVCYSLWIRGHSFSET
jgi:hypothetical protein